MRRAVIRALLLTLALAIAACGRTAPPAEAPSFRRGGEPIASAAIFDLERAHGLWHVVARFPNPAEAGRTGDTVSLLAPLAGGGVTFQRDWNGGSGYVQASSPMPGRFVLTPTAAIPAAQLWVLWVAGDYETLVIGTPDGTLGWVLNRRPDISAERLGVAREILDFNGYDATRLQRTP
ncbi:lipocalin family protein [Wenxinia marina]|uniref:lipocalin family protein n=1 Tax=Wenxinia marina TaxID=390641 RepID=UPI000375AEB3|nr:lipocalin family protein [Wenxinia marina]